MFFGLSLRQFIFSVLACGVAVGLYFLLRPRFGTETLSWVCILGAFPFAAMGFIKYNCYHRAFFYVMGIASETRANINQMFNFKEDCIEPEGMHGGWQTSGTVKVCHLAFNLWNGYAEEGRERYFTPEELFCCEFAPYFMEGIKVRYPEYCRELPAPRKQTEISR